MSKDEGRQGNPSLPIGQVRRGFSISDSVSDKVKTSLMSIGDPSDAGVVTSSGVGTQSLTAGFPNVDSRNSVKDGDTWLPDDNRINRGYTFQGDGAPDTGGITVVNANRFRQGLPTPTPPSPMNGPDADYPNAPVHGDPASNSPRQ